MFSVVLSTEMESDVALFFTPDLTGFGAQRFNGEVACKLQILALVNTIKKFSHS